MGGYYYGFTVGLMGPDVLGWPDKNKIKSFFTD
jgi:hypothetical protein